MKKCDGGSEEVKEKGKGLEEEEERVENGEMFRYLKAGKSNAC